MAAGFEDLGPMKLHPGEFDGHIEHMMYRAAVAVDNVSDVVLLPVDWCAGVVEPVGVHWHVVLTRGPASAS